MYVLGKTDTATDRHLTLRLTMISAIISQYYQDLT